MKKQKKRVNFHPNRNRQKRQAPIPAHVTDEAMVSAIRASRAKRVRGKRFKGYVKFSGSMLEQKLTTTFPELGASQMIDLLLKYDRIMWYVKQDGNGDLWIKTFTKKQVANRLGVKLSADVLATPASVLLDDINLKGLLRHNG